MSFQIFRRALIVGVLLSLLLPAAAMDYLCQTCRQAIADEYLFDQQGRIYCSERCFEATLAKCAACGGACRRQFFSPALGRMYCSETCLASQAPRCTICRQPCLADSFQSGNDFYCSQACLDQRLPHCHSCGAAMKTYYRITGLYGSFEFCEKCARLPLCYACQLPQPGKTLADGRFLCRQCYESAVTDPDEIARIFEKTRELLEKKLSFEFDHVIELYSVDLPTLKQNAAADNLGSEVGSYVFSAMLYTKTVSVAGQPEERQYLDDERCSIYVLNLLPEKRLSEVFAHELTHDYLRHRYGTFEDLKLEEGTCEYVAARVNTLLKRPGQNIRFELNPDPVYGDGYRQAAEYVKKHGWRAYLSYLGRQPRRPLPPGK